LKDNDKLVLFLLLVCAYKVLNPSDTCEKTPSSFTSQNFQTTSLYDCMDIDEDMPLSVVKEQLTHFKVKKVIDDECRTFCHGGEPKKGNSPMLGLLLVKSWELWGCRLK